MDTQQIRDQITQALDVFDLSKYPRAHVVFEDQNANWIGKVAPKEEDTKGEIPFIGSEALNIIIFTAPNSDYDPETVLEHDDTKRIIKTYDVFPRYRTLTFVEVGTATQSDEDEETEGALDDLLEFETRLIEICEKLEDYGFKYGGQLDKRNGVGDTIIEAIDKWVNGRN